MARLTKYFMCMTLFSLNTLVIAAVAEEIPEAKTWYDSLTPAQLGEIKAARVITVVESFANQDQVNGAPKFKTMNFGVCNKVSYLECISPMNANFSVSLNGPEKVKGVSGAFALTGADSLVVLSGEKPTLVGEGGKSTLSIKLKTKDPSKFDVKSLAELILSTVGYDGVILASAGDYVLVGSTERRLKRVNLQGLAIADSQDKWALSASQRKGKSLLSLVNRNGSYGVFQLVMGGDNVAALEPGTKVLLESK